MVHVMGMWWPPHTSVVAVLHSAVFLALASATLYYFLQSLLEGPGFVPVGWKPVSFIFPVARNNHKSVPNKHYTVIAIVILHKRF